MAIGLIYSLDEWLASGDSFLYFLVPLFSQTP